MQKHRDRKQNVYVKCEEEYKKVWKDTLNFQ